MRKEALSWWGELSSQERQATVETWKLTTTHFAKTWSYMMISSSTSMIELIYTDLHPVKQ